MPRWYNIVSAGLTWLGRLYGVLAVRQLVGTAGRSACARWSSPRSLSAIR